MEAPSGSSSRPGRGQAGLVVLGELGWIAAETFGSRATFHAFIIIQHSDDLPLLRAAMPFIEKDFREGDYAQSFALLRIG